MTEIDQALRTFARQIPEEVKSYSVMDMARAKGYHAAAQRIESMHAGMLFWILRLQNTMKDLPSPPIDGLTSEENDLKSRIVKDAVCRGRRSGIHRHMPDAPCEVRKSPIHGLGVFATRDVPAFTYLTMYPTDGLKWAPIGVKTNHVAWGWLGETKFDGEQYALAVPEPKGAEFLTILGDPSQKDNPHFLGHLINDGARCKSLKASAVYECVSLAKCNAIFCPVVRAVFSIKSIEKGQEILIHYGAQYWVCLSLLQQESE